MDEDLTTALEQLSTTPFPPAPDDQELAEWRADLAEMDAFYAGIATTVINGGRVEHYLEDLDTLAATLESIHPRSEADRRVLQACHDYLERLITIRQAIKLRMKNINPEVD